MANKYSTVPISFREVLLIVAIFVTIFGAIFKNSYVFYIGLSLVIILIIERIFGLVFNPGKSKVNLESEVVRKDIENVMH